MARDSFGKKKGPLRNAAALEFEEEKGHRAHLAR
jgi:hypothetical protein